MFNRIKKLLEGVITSNELDVLNKYSKSTPQFQLDKYISYLNKKGYKVEILKETPDNFIISIDGEKTTISKYDLLNDNAQ